ncbi:metal ABC transporter solute-binding protein, Zn/Mn family [Natrinema hispanicum]|uniref:Zinc transport system substrate-binding protein n=1 Tax=Natrinema hispanicum TaxID=392421 RepID=A0A1I0INH8_9EURY|nr:zinc ABC transporter substrate-binding protein [Natrinema hispanicum]SDD41443.1 zinc transport system substrate-binding protein [Natrinema hispanicum]SET98696.1 zinc transport system substrate-binding protein [Natrinema hispanicum]
MSQHTRRQVIATSLGAATLGTVAGCLSDSSGSDGTVAQSSFFVFGDFASKVAGDTATAETLVPIGQHGHGWEPGPKVQGTILESDLFIHGMEGFQPWADDLVHSVQDDDANVQTVAVGEGISLLEGGHDHGGEDDHGHDVAHSDDPLDSHAVSHACGHMEDGDTDSLTAAPSAANAATFSQTHQPYAVELPEETGYVAFEADEGGEYAFFTDTHDTVHPTSGSVVHEAHSVESCDSMAEYYVVHTESGTVTLELTDDTGSSVTVLAEGVSHDDGEHDHGTADDHDHAGSDEEAHAAEEDGHDHDHASSRDPHFWLDPMRAKQAVETIRDSFADVDGDNTEAYTENADAYSTRLDELDDAFQSKLQNASKDVVFVAGHNAFQYLGQRYEFDVQTLTGLSPDDQPTPKDIERAQEVIAEHDLEYVCADPLESQTAAEQLVEETDATDVLPLTPIPGQTQEWADEGWGYVEIMENINLETLTEALDA